MKNRLYVVLTSLFTILCVHGSEPAHDCFKRIESHSDIEAFAGCVVAYKTNSYYLGSDEGYPIDSDESVKYGYIRPDSHPWNSGEEGHAMERLLRPTENGGACALIDSKVKKGALLVRRVTSEESEKIKEAVSSDKAKLGGIYNKEEAFAMLSGQIEAYWQSCRLKHQYQCENQKK